MKRSGSYIVKNPKLSIIMPAYNEEATIAEIVRKVNSVPLKKRGIDREIIIVDNRSRDSTLRIAKQLEKKHSHIKVIRHTRSQGKGGAVKAALKHATGDVIIIQDADLEYNPDDYLKCILPILKGKAEVVYGSRRLGSRRNKPSGLSYYIGGVGITWIFNFLFLTWLTDEPTCYKTFRSDIIKGIRINGDRFDWEPEVTAKMIKRGIRIKEVPIRYTPRSVEQGKKIRWKDGIEAVWTMVKYRFMD